VAAIAAAAAVAVGAAATVGGVLPAPTSMVASGDRPASTTSSAPAPAPVPAPAPAPTTVEHLLPGSPPEGLREALAGRSASPVRATTSMDVYVAGGDHLAERALVVVRASERAVLDALLPFAEGTRTTIDGRPARAASLGRLRGLDLSTSTGAVAVIGRSLDEGELRAAAAALVADGQVTRGIPDGLRLAYQGRHPFVQAPADDVVFARYASNDGLREIELRTVTGGAAPVAAIAWQLEGERRGVDLRGTQGVLVTVADPESGSTSHQLHWSEGAAGVSVIGRGVPADDLLAFARSLRPADRAEIDDLVARSEASLSED